MNAAGESKYDRLRQMREASAARHSMAELRSAVQEKERAPPKPKRAAKKKIKIKTKRGPKR